MIRCKSCVIPDTRPDTAFIEGECSACVNFRKRPAIDWDARRKELEALLDRHHGRCIVPSSGGKDSTYQALTLLEMGADVTLVTASTCHLTPVGRLNLDNLARYAKTYEITPNRTVRATLNRLGLTLVGDISWPEHVGIFTTPFRAAVDLNIPLIFYGENPQDQYGGPVGSEQAREMTLRWRSEFGGFLGLRPSDLVGRDGITEKHMRDYTPPGALVLSMCGSRPEALGVEAHFLGQYLPWDSAGNLRKASAHGFTTKIPSPANWWSGENLDNAQTGIHDYGMFLKYGYGRGAAQVSVDIRAGLITRDDVMPWVKDYDGRFPSVYAGVTFTEMCDRIGMPNGNVLDALNNFTNHELFLPRSHHGSRPILKEFAVDATL